MDELKIRSTSNSSAVVSAIPLRTTSSTRLVFQPMLVVNPHNREASVKGTFVFQRKGKNDDWEAIPTEPLSTLKKNEGYQLDLKSGEVYDLYTHLSTLYRLVSREGIPTGEQEYIRASGAVLSLSELSNDQLRVFFDANSAVGSDLVRRLLAWASESADVSQLVAFLESAGHRAIGNLGVAISLTAIKDALAVWQNSQNEGDEEFWQTFLTERSFLLEQLFSWPCTVVAEKAYLGGKSVENRGSHILDFLVKNRITDSAALVEIKKPSSPLIGRDYRGNIPNISGELAGAIVQVLTYRASLNETYRSLGRSAVPYEVFDPPCVVIVGRAGTLRTPEQTRSFELFRRQLKGVEIVAFDELFGRLERLMHLLETRPQPDTDRREFDEPESPF